MLSQGTVGAGRLNDQFHSSPGPAALESVPEVVRRWMDNYVAMAKVMRSSIHNIIITLH